MQMQRWLYGARWRHLYGLCSWYSCICLVVVYMYTYIECKYKSYKDIKHQFEATYHQTNQTNLLLRRQCAHAWLASRGRMEDRARSVWQELTKQHQDLPLAAFAVKASTREQSVRRQTQRARGVQQTRTRLQGARPCLLAPAMPAQLALPATLARSVLPANTKWRREMLRAPTVWRDNIQRRKVPHLTCARRAQRIPTPPRQVMSKSTASATLARLAMTEAHAPSVLPANTKYHREMLRVPTAKRANFQRRSVPHQTNARRVLPTPTPLRQVMSKPTASVMLAHRGRMEDRARRVWREPTKQHQDPPLAVIAGKASTREQSVQQQIQRAQGVQRCRIRWYL